jgi:hypothetical protein
MTWPKSEKQGLTWSAQASRGTCWNRFQGGYLDRKRLLKHVDELNEQLKALCAQLEETSLPFVVDRGGLDGTGNHRSTSGAAAPTRQQT